MSIELNWESIADDTERAKVPGGWLVKTYQDVCHHFPDSSRSEGWDWRVAMCFVPDPKHEWK